MVSYKETEGTDIEEVCEVNICNVPTESASEMCSDVEEIRGPYSRVKKRGLSLSSEGNLESDVVYCK